MSYEMWYVVLSKVDNSSRDRLKQKECGVYVLCHGVLCLKHVRKLQALHFIIGCLIAPA
jgi:hypothetical protein